MKCVGVLVVLVLAISLITCGGGSGSATQATGAWSETLVSSTGQQIGSFSFNMMQNNTTLTGSGMNFSGMPASFTQCFGPGTTITGTMGSGMMNGSAMNMTMSWTPQGSTSRNTMTMQGTMGMGMGSGSGTFSITGQTAGCSSQTGTFTMTRNSSSMM